MIPKPMPTFIFKISPHPVDFHTENEKFRFDFFLIKTRKHQKKHVTVSIFQLFFTHFLTCF